MFEETIFSLKLQVLRRCKLTYVSMKYVMKARCVAIDTEIVAGMCRHVCKGNGTNYAKETIGSHRFLKIKLYRYSPPKECVCIWNNLGYLIENEAMSLKITYLYIRNYSDS